MYSSVASQNSIFCGLIITPDQWSGLGISFPAYSAEYAGKEIPRPDHWSGVIISPQKIEFWEATDEYTSRLHNRFVFELQNDQWVTKRLYP